MPDSPPQSRREFLSGVLRYAAFSGLIFGIGGLVARGRAADCNRHGPCPGCPKFGGCPLPSAQEAKQADARSLHP